MKLRILLIVLVTCVASDLSAQIQRVRGSATRSIDSIIPRSGAVGAEVVVKATLMPAITPLRVGFGAFAGFEAFDMVLSTEKGELTMRANVPQWATWDKSYRFIVFDVYFQPIAMSEPFYATNADGVMLRQGVVSRENPQCVTLQETTGEVHSLTGEIAALKNGERAKIEGYYSGVSKCSTGAAIRVTKIY